MIFLSVFPQFEETGICVKNMKIYFRINFKLNTTLLILTNMFVKIKSVVFSLKFVLSLLLLRPIFES